MEKNNQPVQLTHWKKFFNKDYLGTWSLPADRDAIVTIDRVERAEIKGEGGRVDIRPIVFFREFKEPMVLNATNGKTIHRLLNSEFVENWYGHRIQIYAEKNIRIGKGANAEVTDGLRVRPFLPPTDTERQKADLKGKIRAALSVYQGGDIAEIKANLNTAQETGKDSIAFLEETLRKIAPKNG